MKTKRKKILSKSEELEVPSGTKAHPWRFCPIGKHAVRSHPLHIRPSKAHPDGLTTRQLHCASNPSGKDVLNAIEIDEIASEYFSKLKGLPCPLDLGFVGRGSDYDNLIRGWVKYWNDVLTTGNSLDPNIVKALVASESGFDPTSGARWLFHKREMASHRLGREATWDEAIEEYKGVLKKRISGIKVNPKVMGVYRDFRQRLENCAKDD